MAKHPITDNKNVISTIRKAAMRGLKRVKSVKLKKSTVPTGHSKGKQLSKVFGIKRGN